MRRRIESSQLPLHSGFSFRYLFDHGQHRDPQILYRMEQNMLRYAAFRAPAELLVQKNLMIVGYITGH